MNIQTDQQQNMPQVATSEIAEQGDEGECCVFVRDLDSGAFSCVDPDTMQDLEQLPSARKTSAWENYWEEREALKHQLIKYVNNNMADKLEELLDCKCKNMDINEYIYMDGWTLLHQAVTSKSCEVVKILLNHGIDINAVTQSMKRTALHLAVLQKTQSIITLLLARGANPNAVDTDLCTPLHYAAEFGYVQIVKIFLCECQNLGIQCMNVKKMTVMGCCRDLRIRDMIKEYCGLHGIVYQHNQYEGGEIIDAQKEKVYLARTRSDVIEKILNESNKPYSSCQTIDKKQPQFVSILKKQSTYPVLGSRINKAKLQKMKAYAKRSIESFNQAQQAVSVQSMQNYELIRQLGSGTFGTVFLIRKKKSSKLFALKRLSKKLIIENKMKKYAYAERQILKKIKHPFILHASSFFQDPAYLYMVMDFCAGGDLEKQVRKAKFSQEKAKKYCCQIILALEELHKRNYLFRDLKVANVLLDQFGHAKLADFGLAKQSEMSHSFLGSVSYLAPQMLVETDNKPHTACMDWYLLGVFVYEMIVGFPPFFNENRMVMFEQIKREKPRIPSSLTPECKDFLMKTLAKKPHERLGYGGAEQIKKHGWFKQIDWGLVLQRGLAMEVPQINQRELRTKEYIQQQQRKGEGYEGNNFGQWDYFEGERN